MSTASDHPAREAADWDLSAFFPSVDSSSYLEAFERFSSDVDAWEASEPDVTVEQLLALQALLGVSSHFATFLHCESAAHTADVAVKKAMGRFATEEGRLDACAARLEGRLGAMTPEAFDQLVGDPRVAEVSYYVGWMRQRGRHTMGAEKETLAAELGVDGISAWERLRRSVVGPLTFSIEIDGQATETRPISQYRMLTQSGDQSVRHAAFRGAEAAWESIAQPCAAAINGIAGARLTLGRHRGVDDPLAPSASDAYLDVATIDTLMGAVRDRPDVLRSLLSQKASDLGCQQLHAADLVAPNPTVKGESIPWATAGERLLQATSSTYPGLRTFAARALKDRWIDHAMRENKGMGGFSITSAVAGESRIFMTYGGTQGDCATIDHELGHAHHAQLLADLPTWAKQSPMGVNETASTFAEAAVAAGHGQNLDLTADQRHAVQDHRRTHAIEYLGNTTIRFEIEREIYRRRADGELSVEDLCAITLEAQKRIYGDAVDPATLSPWIWVSVQHFYFAFTGFYNYPYTFGFLLSAWLWGEVESRGPDFLTTYESFLKLSGSASAEDAAQQTLGVDLRSANFWNEALDRVQSQR